MPNITLCQNIVERDGEAVCGGYVQAGHFVCPACESASQMAAPRPVRAFRHLSRCWYGSATLDHAAYTDDVLFGLYHRDSGVTGEMAVRWYSLGGKSVPCLEVFDDAWALLAKFPDVIAAMAKADGQNITPVQFCDLLSGCGFEDWTESTRQ